MRRAAWAAIFVGGCGGGAVGGGGGDGDGAAGSVDGVRSFDDGAEPRVDGVPHPSLESLRNLDPLFRRHATDDGDALAALGFAHDDFSEPASPDNGDGPGGEGQFRIACQWSHFGYDDPIVRRGEAGAAHLHMFWGNTATDAWTDATSLVAAGGGTCQGFELNRSSYWVPALLDTGGGETHVVIPDAIIIYYKSRRPSEVHPMPKGLELLGGNVAPGGLTGADFGWTPDLFWSCGNSGFSHDYQGRIPLGCPPGEPINATLSFPQCVAVDDRGQPRLSSSDHASHVARVDDTEPCPASHPYRIPHLSYLLYWPNGRDGNGAGVEDWRLSSDLVGGTPGGSLHGDWFGGWHQAASDAWIAGCFDPAGEHAGPRNCSQGQTGQNGTGRSFRRVSPLNDYEGDNLMLLPR